MPFVTNPFPRAKAKSWPETLLSNARPSSNDSFCKILRAKSSKIPVATTPAKRAYPECGTLLPDESEFCPVCALRGAVEPQRDSVSAISSELHFEHYQVLKNPEGTPLELGRGGMGVTYKAIAARQYDRAIELAPEQPMLKVLKAYFVDFMETGSDRLLLDSN
jgi:hypothetical protein